jgi:hypothetical protein
MEHEQVEKVVAQKSMLVYLPISLGSALLFFLITTISDDYPVIARIGGSIWVGLLSLIVAMPIVISRVKKQFQRRGISG